ncbi:MAG: serine/threonine-protein kinase [Burkholderiaceae bacterium]
MSNDTAANPPPAASVAEHDALPPGTRFGEFEILRVLGVGGFGIVYLTQDHSLERQVALKEYMPAALASRGLGPMITVRSASFAETYAIGLRSFVNEARLLARFDHPSLVKVYRFWEDNATAYMVMPYLQGITLRDARKAMLRAPDEAWVLGVIHPMLDALELLHREGVYHRDIAPDNILLPPVGQPILLDFGAARHVISDRTQSLTAILKPSYAPIEQYAEMTQMRQGPWTDLYALGAVMHFLLFGVPPAPATARAMQDDAEPIEQRVVPGVSQRLLDAVGWALRVRPLERPQNVAELRAALKGLLPVPVRVQGLGQGGALPAAAATSAVTFQPTLMVEPADPQATRINTVQAPPMPPIPRVQPAAPPRPAASMPAAPQRPVAAAAPVHHAAPPAPKRGLVFAALAAAVVVGGLVLWQFVGLLGGSRAPAVATAEPASAVASVAVAAPAVPSAAPPAVAAALPLGAAASAQAATDAALAAVAQAQGLAVPGKAAPADAGKPVALVAPGASAALLAASAASGARAKAVAGGSRPDGSAPAPGTYADAAASRPLEARARPVPAAQREPAVVATPVAAAPTGAATAREMCGSRLFIALAICMDRECEQPRYRDHPECVRVLEVKRKREQAQ